MIKLRQLKINIDDDSDKKLESLIATKLNIKRNDIINIKIVKKSIDARKKPLIYFIYEVDIEVNNESQILEKNNSNDVLYTKKEEYKIIKAGDKESKNISIIGAGPAGLICAYELCSLGYTVNIFEKGKAVEERIVDIEDFWQSGNLNKNSNVQFGEGGAGTFSDGKLNTLIKDKENRGKHIFEILVDCGAPKEILYDAKPHIGTDILRSVIINLRKKIIDMGGTFDYESELTEIFFENDEITKIQINNTYFLNTNCVILAIGHSARNTFEMLYRNNIKMESKPFAVGFRIMHDQKLINKSQIGVKHHPKLLEQSYKLTCNLDKNRGVYTFCMCPGGYVVNASSEEKKLVINGMSNYARESETANSAIIVTINNLDYGKHVLDGIEFQRKIEEKTFDLENGQIPVQKFIDFKENKTTTNLGSVIPKLKGAFKLSNMRSIYSEEINLAIINAVEEFGKKIKGFSSNDVLLAGSETRTSSPVRIIRDENFETSVKGLFAVGEGAGYAGGITSSAIDGLKCAEIIAKKFK